MHLLIILCFLFTFTGAAAIDDPNHISINCGGAAPYTALSGRQWLRDVAPKGSSTTATVKGDLIKAVDPVPYYTARISRSQFSYSFHVSPGQKLIRLHFNPVSYRGFESFSDFFTVEAGPFTLLANFSASITARALAVNTFIKEFCVIKQENQPLNIVFSPETSFHSQYNYAFVNGIEIISIPTTISYCHGGGDSGVHVLGKNYVIHLENTTALEMVHRQDIKWGSLSSDNDRDGMFEMWANKADNRSWEVSVDVGFRYLVRLHLCDQGLKMGFMLLINNMTALTTTDMLKQRRDQASLWYKNYMVMMEGHKREGKRMISICVHSPQGFLDRHGPLEGFEVFKLSNHDLSLASPNPIPPREDSPSQTIHSLLSCLGRRNAIAAVVFALVCMVNIIVHSLLQMVEADSTEEEDKPCDRVKQHCRRFSLAELQSATQNFHDGLTIGRGGFGKVYRGFIDNGREIVAIKRSKPNSSQGEHQFWTEVETLSELRHVNLVSLIGYCIEQGEMMLVYEYMVYGTLADHLYKLSRKSNNFYHLSWKQRLKICIGAGRALDYLHTGHGIIHRDVKSSNILLDEKLVAKVSDFGLAKTGSGSESECQDTTKFKGTFGYIDPDFFKTHKLTKKSDTYAFGVVLLEVLCGRPAVEASNEEDKCSLAIWAIDNISKGQVDQIVTPSLRGDISPDSLKTFVKVAEKCLHNEPKKRPAMAHVVIKLELALQQQDKMESLALNGTASGEDYISCTDISQKEIANDLPCNDRAITLPSLNVQSNTSPPREQFVSTMINAGRKDGIKSTMLRISRRLWSRDAFWKTKKIFYKTEFLGNSASESKYFAAPTALKSSNITSKRNTITNKRADGMCFSPAGEMLPQPNLRVFTFLELKVATRNYRPDSVLGEGGFGTVYKGRLDKKASGKTGSQNFIAVKRLNPESMQGFEEWQSEVNILGRLSHPNLVRLLGYGREGKSLALVYEFMPRGSLESHLFRRNASVQPLPWDIRLKILIGAAHGLAFLHALDKKVIYRDFKPSNILLDRSYHAKLSDFGLAKMAPTDGGTHLTTRVMGTSGYAAPEYLATGHLSVKSDVYGFGVVLLETLTGLRVLDACRQSGQQSLVEWMKLLLSNRRKLQHFIDVRLEGRYPSKSAFQIVQLASTCLEKEPKNRPSMQEVVETLEKVVSAEREER